MESICKNIRLENCKAEGTIQTALEEDINLAENKEDVDKILLQKGKVKIDEVKIASSHAFVKGKILYHILYKTLEEKTPLQSITGSLPFYEDIYINGLENGDHVIAEGKLDDISVHIINSRKLNLRALVILHAISEDIKEEEVCMDLEEVQGINMQKKAFTFVEIVEDKRDIFRVRDEIELPKSMPNISNIVWKDIRLQNVSYKPVSGKIYLKGEIFVFVLYQASAYDTGENVNEASNDLACYDTRISFQGELECADCNENMLLDMQVSLGNEVVDIRQDIDQENRVIGMDCSLDLNIHLYEQKEIEYVADAYGVNQEVLCSYKNFFVKNIVWQKAETIPAEETLELNLENEEIQKLCSAGCVVHLDEDCHSNMNEPEKELRQGQISMPGYLTTEVLYQSHDDDGNVHFKTVMADTPFSVLLDVPQDGRKYQIRVDAMLQDYSVNMQGKDRLDMKATIQVQAKVYADNEVALLSGIDVKPLDYHKIKEIPGMLIYYVKQGDSLWNIGKKYYMDVEKIKELNHLKDDNIKKGDKLLLMKEM